MNKTKRNSILLISIVVGLAIAFFVWDNVGQQFLTKSPATPTPMGPAWFQDIDREIRNYLADPQNPKTPEALDALAERLQQKYYDDLLVGIEELRQMDSTPGPPLSEEQKQQLMFMIIREHIHIVGNGYDKILREMDSTISPPGQP